jgi:hypothetical protein
LQQASSGLPFTCVEPGKTFTFALVRQIAAISGEPASATAD